MNYKKAEIFFLYLLLIYSIYCAVISGMHWDATTHMKKGEYIYKYIFSLGRFNYDLPEFHKFFPGLVFFLKNFLSKIFPKYYEFEIENVLNLLISFSSLFALSKINKILFNKKIGKISFILLFFFPAFFGHSLMNPKDTVIMCSFLWTIYYIFKYLNEKNKSKVNPIIIKLSFFIALGSGVRLIFLGTLIPFFIILLAFVIYYKKKINLKSFLIDLFKTFIISFLILITFWPEVHKNIILDPFLIFIDTIKSPPVNNLPGLLNGKFYSSTETPFNQIIINFFYRTPEYIFLIYFFAIFYFIKFKAKIKTNIEHFNFKIYSILFFLASTVSIFILSGLPLYDNMRTYIYLIPVFLIIPSTALYFIIKNKNYKFNQFIFLIIFFIFLLHIYKFVKLTPYQYTYINYFNGSFKNNIYKFENDYLGISIKELLTNTNFLNKPNVKIAVCGHEPTNLKIYLKKNRNYNARIVREDESPDYVILTNRIYWWKKYNNLNEVETCNNHKAYNGITVKSVKRLGLELSAIRKLEN